MMHGPVALLPPICFLPKLPARSLFLPLPPHHPGPSCSTIYSHLAPGPQLEHSAPHSEFGHPRLTHFLEMPLDKYVNIVTAMINDGHFSHIGHGVLRLEGQTTWGVWLRINHKDSRSLCAPPARWCFVSRGEQRTDFPQLGLCCEATLASPHWLLFHQCLRLASHNTLWPSPLCQ